MADAAYGRVHVVINPASGKDEPILNVLNDVFREHGVAWDATVTHRYGDAGDQARAAIADGVDLVVAYGGDGTQHEVANAVVGASVVTGRRTPMGILPGGTGNGFAREVGVPKKVRDATVLLCTSTRTRGIDVGRRGASARQRSTTATSSSGCTSVSSPRSRRAVSSRTGTACSRTRSRRRSESPANASSGTRWTSMETSSSSWRPRSTW